MRSESRKKKAMKLVRKVTTIVLISGLCLGGTSMAANSASVKDHIAVVGVTTLSKSETASRLSALSKTGQQSAVFAARIASKCKPLHMYTDGVVGDPESCIMGDRLSIGGGHTGGR